MLLIFNELNQCLNRDLYHGKVPCEFETEIESNLDITLVLFKKLVF